MARWQVARSFCRYETSSCELLSVWYAASLPRITSSPAAAHAALASAAAASSARWHARDVAAPAAPWNEHRNGGASARG